MNSSYIPFYPLYNLLCMIVTNGISPSCLPALAPWGLKQIMLEPLRLLDLFAFEKQINAHTITQDPVFILGHWRSGTTFLQNILRQDERYGYLTLYNSLLPEVMLGSGKVLRPLADAIITMMKPENKYHRVSYDWNFPGEEDVALTACALRCSPHWGHLFPDNYTRLFDQYLLPDRCSQEYEQLKASYFHLVRKISLQQKGKQLILKTPGNTGRIGMLLELFPNARFIYIHRNPMEVYYSSKRFWQVTMEHSFQKSDERQVEDIILQTYQKVISGYLQQRELIPPGNLMELRYEQFVATPLEWIEKIYAFLAIDLKNKAKECITAFLDKNKSYPVNQYSYRNEEVQKVCEAWAFSYSQWPYARYY